MKNDLPIGSRCAGIRIIAQSKTFLLLLEFASIGATRLLAAADHDLLALTALPYARLIYTTDVMHVLRS